MRRLLFWILLKYLRHVDILVITCICAILTFHCLSCMVLYSIFFWFCDVGMWSRRVCNIYQETEISFSGFVALNFACSLDVTFSDFTISSVTPGISTIQSTGWGWKHTEKNIAHDGIIKGVIFSYLSFLQLFLLRIFQWFIILLSFCFAAYLHMVDCAN